MGAGANQNQELRLDPSAPVGRIGGCCKVSDRAVARKIESADFSSLDRDCAFPLHALQNAANDFASRAEPAASV
jgi:hypothetical protein